MAKLGETLKQLRFKAGMTQSDLANACSINKSSLSNYECNRRNPPYAVLCKMADALQVSVDVLLECVAPEESAQEDVAKENQVDSIRQRRIKRIVSAFDKLSNDAQLIAIERVQELGMIPEYQRKLADTLQQYLYNRCCIKMEAVEEPPKQYNFNEFLEWLQDHYSYEVDYWEKKQDLYWNVRHITMQQRGVEESHALRWNFHYFSFEYEGGEKPVLTEINEEVMWRILDQEFEYEAHDVRTGFVFDDEEAFDCFYDCYSGHYEGPQYEYIAAPDYVWALFLVVDRETWEIKSEKEYSPYDWL